MKRVLLFSVIMASLLAACRLAEGVTPNALSEASILEVANTPAACPPWVFEHVLPSNPDVAESYIGHHYDELNMPAGEFRAAAVIDIQQDVYAWVKVARPDHQMYWLEKTVCAAAVDYGTRTYYDIIDAICRVTPTTHVRSVSGAERCLCRNRNRRSGTIWGEQTRNSVILHRGSGEVSA